jgi:ATP-binding cassette subfamily C protein
LLLAAVAEGLGLSTLLPLVSLIANRVRLVGQRDLRSRRSRLDRAQPTLGVLLSSSLMFVKAGLVLTAQRQIRYTVAAWPRIFGWAGAILLGVDGVLRQKAGRHVANAFATEAFRASQAYLYGATNIAGDQSLVYFGVAVASWRDRGSGRARHLHDRLLNRLVHMTRRAGARQTRLLRDLLGGSPTSCTQ